jgi:GNAT superfamily N-acetyltransferase
LYRRARAPILKFIFGDKDDQPDTKELPEVVNIFTDPRCRGKGIATDLLAIVERSLLKWNQESYFLKTLNTETNEALHFYRKRGFNEMHRPEAEYIYLQKRCSP